MAADSTFNDTESLPRDTADDPESARAGNAPRPPRPSKRSTGLARIPMPAPAMRSEAGLDGSDDEDDDPMDEADSDAFDSSPAASTQGAPDSAAGPLAPPARSVAKPVSERREESFADLAEDQAPPAPLTPSRGMPAVSAPRGERDSSPAVSVSVDHDREDTTVGEVPRDLLELSGGGGDECTRAYQAPQELIELAKRKREERMRAKAEKVSPEAHLRETQRPPAQEQAAGSPGLEVALKAPRAASDVAPWVSANGSVRPAARASSEQLRAVSSSARPPQWGLPDSARQPLSDPAGNDSAPVVSVIKPRGDISPESLAKWQASYKVPWLGASRRWLIVLGLFVVIGLALSRWSALSQLLSR